MSKKVFWLPIMLILLCTALTLGCSLSEDEDESDGDQTEDGDTSADGDEPADGDGNGFIDGDSPADGDDSPDGDGDDPIVDPLEGKDAPGEYACDGCPQWELPTDFEFTRNLGAVTASEFTSVETGPISGHLGDGVWYLSHTVTAGLRENGGSIVMDENGDYEVKLPLFCGNQTLKLAWTNGGGTSGIVMDLTTTDCVEDDIRVTLSWGAGANDLELHFIRGAGKINQAPDDCTWTNMNPDWGTADDPADDPQKDVDHTGDNGIENIFLASPEDTTYHILVEYWATGVPTTARIVVLLENRSFETTLENFTQKMVWDVGVVDWAARTVTWTADTVTDCSGSWSSGCTMDIP